LGIYEPPQIKDKLREGTLGYRSSVRNWSKYNKSLVDWCTVYWTSILSPNGSIPWRKKI